MVTMESSVVHGLTQFPGHIVRVPLNFNIMIMHSYDMND